MDEDQLRSMVREMIARHLGSSSVCENTATPAWKAHASHLRLSVLSGEQGDGPCLIEPKVRCNHCGYCQSLGH